MSFPFAKPGPFATILLLCSARLHAQNLPAAAPTSSPPPAAAAQTAPAAAPSRARIDATGGLLTITADNSSLNQILRDISHLTGMTITGGVTDERVFGTYGPADTSTVLTSLLNGTGSNFLLALDANKVPRELVLSPRQGGPTPPNPNDMRDQQPYNDLPPQQNSRMFNRDNLPQPLLPQQFPQQQPAPQTPPQPPSTVMPTPTGTTTTSTTDTTQQSPNAAKTPQQIYEELMKMQKPTPPPL